MRNHSVISEFILLGLSVDPQIQPLLFVLFLVIYLLTLMGNLMLLLVIGFDSRLHIPMYFFLRQLSFLDLCHSSVTVPKLLENLLSEKKTISVEGCLAQVFFLYASGGTESCLLAVMAYDRYVAISSPLLYAQVMNRQLCMGLVWASWSLAFLDALINILVALNLDFCEAQDIHHFCCELSSLYPLSCSDMTASFIALLCSSVLHFFGNFLLIFFSYVRILSTILRISSSTGRSKAFSTCSSHLTAVIFFYGSGFLRYLMPNSGSIRELIFSLQYSVITPMLNPLIYSLKNKEMKAAVKRMLRKYFWCFK
ncbi:olfactory receptor 8S1-like [Myotis myotis]|uniref:Olfactory receptor n=1 Tax=Myotis myotis TaxID=51298 RepID=A0A7J7Z7C3_MYOMY|nr:olfactory receptor 8S1-like [Myotis myotis]KAF6369925.1 olfactory receptor family 8 subfamily S member 1 [Myotis myotis]